MSSETSIKVLPPERGSHRTGASRGTAEDQNFQVSHFFVLLSLLAATVAVLLARPSAPANLILISLTIGAAGLAALAVYRTFAPLVAPHADLDRQPLSERMRLDLEREKALTLRSIKELEFDRAMGKVSGQDFDNMASRLRARALGIMRQLALENDGSRAYRALIEKELAQRVGKVKVDLPPEGGSHEGGSHEGGSHEAGSRECPCGTRNDADARFCKSCGSKLGTA